MSPDGWRKPKHRYALDNGCFKQFNSDKYFKMLNNSIMYPSPIFIVVPDVLGCHDRTLALWHYFKQKIKPYGPLAFVAQDGCSPETIPSDCDWIFVGGLDPWKQKNIHKYVGLGKKVHVGRVNGIGRLKYCESLGVDSVDGTGWFRARDKKFYDLIEWFEGEKQCSMF